MEARLTQRSVYIFWSQGASANFFRDPQLLANGFGFGGLFCCALFLSRGVLGCVIYMLSLVIGCCCFLVSLGLAAGCLWFAAELCVRVFEVLRRLFLPVFVPFGCFFFLFHPTIGWISRSPSLNVPYRVFLNKFFPPIKKKENTMKHHLVMISAYAFVLVILSYRQIIPISILEVEMNPNARTHVA